MTENNITFDKTLVEKELKELISEMLICTPDDINIDADLMIWSEIRSILSTL